MTEAVIVTNLPTVVDQQLIVHLFAPASGPHADAAYHQLAEIWVACRGVLGMTDPIAGTALPNHIPSTIAGLPGFASATVQELAVAAQEQQGSDNQAILRRHQDVLNLSVAIAPRRNGAAGSWWHELERRRYAVTGDLNDGLLGEAHVYACTLATPPPAAGPLGRHLNGLLPAFARRPLWWQLPTNLQDEIIAWEVGPAEDARTLRQLVIAAPAAREPQLSALMWSNGHVTIPPLARYLLHTAKVRYMLRVWSDDRSGGQPVDHTQARVGALGPASDKDSAAAAHTAIAGLRDDHARAETLQSQLAEMRHSVEIASTNVDTALTLEPLTADAGGFIADDRSLAAWFVTQLGDDGANLGSAIERTERVIARATRSQSTAQEASMDVADIKRHVFVVHGRDNDVRDEMFDFLRTLGLRPLEWEQLVRKTATATPYLGEVVREAVKFAQATLVILSPDDVVDLHADLLEHGEVTQPAMQARPNVLIELGIALGLYPDRTVIVHVGEMRPIADLGGMNYVRLDDSADCRQKIANRLAIAGCEVDLAGTDWLNRKRFAGLSAYGRKPGR